DPAYGGADAGGVLEAGREVEHGAAPRLALDPDATPHQLDQVPTDREPETGPAVGARRRDVGLDERRADGGGLVRGDRDAGVADAEVQDAGARLRRVAGGRAHVEGDRADGRELHGVAQEVDQDLSEPYRVAPEAVGKLLCHDAAEREPLLLRRRPD